MIKKIIIVAAALLLMIVLLETGIRIFNLNEKLIIQRCPKKRDNINLSGFRDIEHAKQKPPGTYRIVIIGDSFTEGEGVDFNYIYPRLLDKELNKLHSSFRYEVVNCSKAGKNASQEVHMYNNKCRNYNPDLIIMGYVLNDTECSGEYNSIKAKYLQAQIFRKPVSSAGTFLFDHSELFKHIWCRLEYTRINKIAKDLDMFYKEENPCYQEFKKAYYFMRNIKITDHTPIVIVMFPYFSYSLQKYPFLHINKQLHAFFFGLGFNVIDLLDAYKPYKNSELKVCEWNAHPNAKAQQIAADTILAYLKQTYLASHLR